jgi:competence protein ComEA
MSRTTRVLAIGLALLVSAPLVYAQQGSTAASSEKQPAQTQPATAPSTAKAKVASTNHAMPKVDLNNATREELAKLPGINEATAEKIVAARPFKSKSELKSKGLVTKAEYGKIASRLIVKSSMTASK